MPKFGTASKKKLATCHSDLQRLFKEVVKHFDCSIIYGHRSVAEQQRLYAQGRTKPGKIVTYRDGVTKLSKHQGVKGKKPSHAVDAVPYPIDWEDTNRMRYFAGFVMATAKQMGIDLTWGGDFDGDTNTKEERFQDLPHFQK